jgi:hypothetical protein
MSVRRPTRKVKCGRASDAVHPARPTGGMPSDLPPTQRAGCRPNAGGIFLRIKKVSYSRRDPREGPRKKFGTSRSRPLDGREVSGPTPPAHRAGGTHFLKFFESASLFRI